MARSEDLKDLAARFKEQASKVGVSVSMARLLGPYLHVDYARETDKARVLEMLSAMAPTKIYHLTGGVDGRHLDGSNDHRIVACFGSHRTPEVPHEA